MCVGPNPPWLKKNQSGGLKQPFINTNKDYENKLYKYQWVTEVGNLAQFMQLKSSHAACRSHDLAVSKMYELKRWLDNHCVKSPIILSRGYCLSQAFELGFFLPAYSGDASDREPFQRASSWHS